MLKIGVYIGCVSLLRSLYYDQGFTVFSAKHIERQPLCNSSYRREENIMTDEHSQMPSTGDQSVSSSRYTLPLFRSLLLIRATPRAIHLSALLLSSAATCSVSVSVSMI